MCVIVFAFLTAVTTHFSISSLLYSILIMVVKTLFSFCKTFLIFSIGYRKNATWHYTYSKAKRDLNFKKFSILSRCIILSDSCVLISLLFSAHMSFHQQICHSIKKNISLVRWSPSHERNMLHRILSTLSFICSCHINIQVIRVNSVLN